MPALGQIHHQFGLDVCALVAARACRFYTTELAMM